MKNAVWVALTLSALALAGCVKEDEDPLTNDDCLAQGLILDPAVEQVDNETGETFVGPACVEDVPSVTVHLEGAPETAEAWFPIELTWVLHTTLETDHSHNNGIRVSTVSDPSYVGKLDGYGELVTGAKEEHRDFTEGDSSTVEWRPEEAGTYYVRAYAVSSWGNYWAPEHKITITEVQPTGNKETVSLSGGGLPSASTADPADLEIALGDEVQWTTDEPVTWTITRTNGPDGADSWDPVTSDGDSVVFTVPGLYKYEATTDASGDSGGATGTINVLKPE